MRGWCGARLCRITLTVAAGKAHRGTRAIGRVVFITMLCSNNNSRYVATHTHAVPVPFLNGPAFPVRGIGGDEETALRQCAT